MPSSRVGGPVPERAREGRQKQKYGQDGERLLAGCVPFRVSKNHGENVDSVEVLLVTRRNGEGWVIPKGGWEIDEIEVEHAALRETMEEAGVRGKLEGPVLGVFEFQSKKGNCLSESTCLVHVFGMEVQEQLGTWPEGSFRKRKWFPVAEAHNLCLYPWMCDAIGVLMQRKNWTRLINGATCNTTPNSNRISSSEDNAH